MLWRCCFFFFFFVYMSKLSVKAVDSSPQRLSLFYFLSQQLRHLFTILRIETFFFYQILIINWMFMINILYLTDCHHERHPLCYTDCRSLLITEGGFNQPHLTYITIPSVIPTVDSFQLPRVGSPHFTYIFIPSELPTEFSNTRR